MATKEWTVMENPNPPSQDEDTWECYDCGQTASFYSVGPDYHGEVDVYCNDCDSDDTGPIRESPGEAEPDEG